MLEPRDLRLHRPRPAGRLLERGVPHAAGRRPAALRRHRRRATGRTWAPSTPTSGPTRTSSTARCRSTSPASSSADGVWLGEGAEIHPDAVRRRPGGHRRQLPRRGRRPHRAVHGARRQRPGARRRRSSSGPWSTTTPTSARRCGCGARWSAGPATCATGVRAEEGVVIGDECFIGEDALARRRASRCTRSRRSRPAPSSTTRSCGSRGAPAACSAATASSGWPTSTSPPSSPPRWPWPTARCSRRAPRVITSRDSSRSARMLKRAMMAGLNAAGVDVRGPRGGLGAGHPLHRAPPVATPAGVTIRLVHDDPQSVIIRFFDDRRPRHHRGRAAQDRAPVQPGGLPPGVPGRDRRHRLRPPGARALRHRARGHRRRRAASGPPQFKVVIDYAFGSTSFAMPNVLAKLGARGAGRQPVRVHRRAHARPTSTTTPSGVADLVRASGSHLGAVLDPDGEQPHADRRRGPRPRPTTRRCWPCSRCSPGKIARRPGGPAGLGHPAGHRAARRRARRRGRWSPSCPTRRSWTRPPSPGVGFAGNTDGGFILPGFLPAFDAAATFIKVLDLLAYHERALSRWWPSCPASTWPTRWWSRPWEQKGTVMRTLVEQSKDREVDLVDGVKVHHDDGLGPGPARSRGAGDPRVGRGAPPTPRPGAWPRSTPGASARSCAEAPRRGPVDPPSGGQAPSSGG